MSYRITLLYTFYCWIFYCVRDTTTVVTYILHIYYIHTKIQMPFCPYFMRVWNTFSETNPQPLMEIFATSYGKSATTYGDLATTYGNRHQLWNKLATTYGKCCNHLWKMKFWLFKKSATSYGSATSATIFSSSFSLISTPMIELACFLNS